MHSQEKYRQTIKAENVNHQGSLGLLALGDVGLFLWREKKATYQSQMAKNQREENSI